MSVVVALVACLVLPSSCDSIDCSLNNTVLCQIGFYDADGDAVALTDTLTITAAGTDSVLYNCGVRTSSVGIPLSYYQASDTLILTVFGRDYSVSDSLIITKRNYEHFESLDCPVKMMHAITDTRSSHLFIDSVVIVSPDVVYNNGENIKVYLHSAD